MDFRSTYSGPGSFESRPGCDPFAQLGKDTRQERDDRARQESSNSKGFNRPTQSSVAKNTDNRNLRSTLSARSSGRFSSFSQSVDLGPALRGNSQAGSGIPRHYSAGSQQATTQQQSAQNAAAATASPAVREKLQDLIDAGQQREALLHEEIRRLEEDLRSGNSRCTELERALQQANAALQAERATAARLRTERDEHAAQLDRARCEAAEYLASGNIAITTSEVCRAALSTAFKGTVSAIGIAHEELESVLASQQQQKQELQACRQLVLELERALREKEQELEEARAARRGLSEEMEELAGRLQAREDTLDALVELLVPSHPGAPQHQDRYGAAVTLARDLTARAQQLDIDLAHARCRVTDYQAQMQRMGDRLGSAASTTSGMGKPCDLEAQVSELAEEREQLEGDNLQLAAENEQLRRDNAGLRNRLEEALVAAAVVAAASERDMSAAAEVARLHQQLTKTTAQAEEWRQQAEAARALVEEAQKRAEESAKLLQEASAQAEAARTQAKVAREELVTARVEEDRKEVDAVREELEAWQAQAEAAERAQAAESERAKELEAKAAALTSKLQDVSIEAAQLRVKVADLQDCLAADRRESQKARDQLNAMHANEDALMQRILAGEVERQQLLRQIDTNNSVMAGLRQRSDEATQQAAEVADLRCKVASLAEEAEQQAKAAAAAAARLAPLETELEELRDAVRANAERASQDARLQERREQQLAVLRQQVREAEAAQLQADKEINLLRAQVSVNDSLRARVEDLQARLAQATLPKPCTDASVQATADRTATVTTAAASTSTADLVYRTSSGGGAFPAHPVCLDGVPPLVLPHAAAARQSMATGRLHPGGAPPYTPTDHRSGGGSLPMLESYNAIPEDVEEDSDCDGRARQQPSSKRHPQGKGTPRAAAASTTKARQPLRCVLGMVVKGTLVAGGMALGLALSATPQGGQAREGHGGKGPVTVGTDGGQHAVALVVKL